MRLKTIYLIIAVIFAVSMLSGCSNGKKWKSDVEQAITKQSEISNYRFQGSAQLNIQNTLANASLNPLTSTLFNQFKHSKIEWTGVANTNPVRLELQVKITPQGSASVISIPMIIKDNKMYVSIPVINQPDEYYMIDLDQLSKQSGQKNPFSTEQFKNASNATNEILQMFMNSIDPKWYTQQEVTLSGKKENVISVTITDKNVKEISQAWMNTEPKLINTLKNKLNVTAPSTSSNGAQVALQAPGYIKVGINEQGYLNQQNVQLNYTVTKKDGTKLTNQIQYTQVLSDINQNPPFTMKIPTKIKSFSDILKLLYQVKQ